MVTVVTSFRAVCVILFRWRLWTITIIASASTRHWPRSTGWILLTGGIARRRKTWNIINEGWTYFNSEGLKLRLGEYRGRNWNNIILCYTTLNLTLPQTITPNCVLIITLYYSHGIGIAYYGIGLGLGLGLGLARCTLTYFDCYKSYCTELVFRICRIAHCQTE